MESLIDLFAAARGRILDNERKTGGQRRGEVLCPKCRKVALKYAVLGVRNHVHAKCQTPGCPVAWME